MSSCNRDNHLSDKPSTRVRAPPGGASSISFGGYDEPAAAPKAKTAVPLAPSAAPTAAYAPAAAAPVAPKATAAAAAAGGGVSSNVFANGANQNCGNFITDRSTTRLHAPPGGRSSITLG